MMDNDKKLAFVHKMSKMALEHVQHFDGGGAVNPQSQGVAGSIGNTLGTNDNFQAGSANINAGTNTGQLNTAYTGVQGALGQQQGVTNTLNAGLNQGAASQAALGTELNAEAAGQGPNPAQAALNQNTGQNIAQQAALAAGTRGAGANAGLIASQNAQQGAATQQAAVGQSATLQAQQQLAAQNAAANLAATEVGQGAGATQTLNQAQQNEQNVLQGANTAANNANVSMQENINNVNAATAATNQNANQNVISGVANGIGGAISSLFAKGGVVPASMKHLHDMAKIYHPHYAGGGEIGWNSSQPAGTLSAGSGPNMPAHSAKPLYSTGPGKPQTYNNVGSADISDIPGSTIDSYTMPEMGSQYAGAAPSIGLDTGLGMTEAGSAAPALGLALMAKGGKVGERLKAGGKVPGKPMVDHDAYKNDTVSAKLTPGEVVIDLNTLKDKGDLGKAARFVANTIMSRKAMVKRAK